jgi:tRNA modification GTPase
VFTKRPFLNGRLDLTEAEAVADLIEAETAAARNAAAQLGGSLRRDFEAVYDRLLDMTSQFYAVVDYPDEDIQDLGPAELAASLRDCAAVLDRLLATCDRGRVLKSGVRTAINGRPNAGRAPCSRPGGYERPSSPHPGTKREQVEGPSSAAECGCG